MNLAKEAYEAYANHTGWKSLATGSPLPPWDSLSAEIQTAWQVSAAWVVGRVVRSRIGEERNRSSLQVLGEDDYWHKIVVILLNKHRRLHEVITAKDVHECHDRENNLVVQELPDGLHLRLVNDATADAIVSRN